MKVFAEPLPRTVGRCLFRITDQIKRYAPPDVTFTKEGEDHDLQILQVWCPACRGFLTGKPYAVWMHEYVPDILTDALLVTSWIPDMMDGDKFLPLPLGVDPEVFYPEPCGDPHYKILTSGYVASTEYVQEAANAAWANGGKVAHLGGNILGGNRDHFENIPDSQLRRLYRETEYVSALRTRVGFEMMGVESLASRGGRPIVFSYPATDWYRKWAVTIEERSHPEVEEQLTAVLSKPAVPVSEEERAEVVATLSWESVMKRFWSELMVRL